MAPVGLFERFPHLDFAGEGHTIAANNIPILFMPANGSHVSLLCRDPRGSQAVTRHPPHLFSDSSSTDLATRLPPGIGASFSALLEVLIFTSTLLMNPETLLSKPPVPQKLDIFL